MKATELLQTQHREIENLFQQLLDAPPGGERAAREELAQNLVGHSVIEREIFYKAVRDALPEEIEKSIEDHGLVEYELQRLLTTRIGDQSAGAKAAVLQEIFDMHTREEEDVVLKRAPALLGDHKLEELGARMEARFKEVVHGGYTKFLQKTLAENLPKVRARPAAKKAARRPAAKKQARVGAAGPKARVTPKRRATTRRKPSAAAGRARAAQRKTGAG